MTFDSLGDRIKGYEQVSDSTLPIRLPVVIRVDGRAFHTYTKRLDKPFDERFMAAMDGVALELCSEIQGARLAYVQSDEISVLINNYEALETQAWFGNRLQKMVSVAASIAAATMTMRFGGELGPAHFDARAFVLPEAEIVNYFLWRQNDWVRNSIQLLARSRFSHRECHEKCQAELLVMCEAAGSPWAALSSRLQRGRCVVRKNVFGLGSEWVVDDNIPIFKDAGRGYVETAFRGYVLHAGLGPDRDCREWSLGNGLVHRENVQ